MAEDASAGREEGRGMGGTENLVSDNLEPAFAAPAPTSSISEPSDGARLIADAVAARAADIGACWRTGGAARVRSLDEILAPRIDTIIAERDAMIGECARLDFLLGDALAAYQHGRDALRAEIDRLRAALEPILERARMIPPGADPIWCEVVTVGMLRAALAAAEPGSADV